MAIKDMDFRMRRNFLNDFDKKVRDFCHFLNDF